jgi:hypothetical protein
MKVLFGDDLRKALYEIIEKSQNTLKIISPFVDFWDKQLKRGEQKWNKMIDLLNTKRSILEIYTQPHKEYKEHKEYIENKSVDHIKKVLKNDVDYHIIQISNLHAKVYINDDAILLSSMNLTYHSFNRSLDFGVITETNEEYLAALDYCEKYIFICNNVNQETFKDEIVNYFSPKKIEASFPDNNCLSLKKDENISLRCYSDSLCNDINNMALHLDVGKNCENEILSRCKVRKKTGKNSKGRYIVKKEEYGTPGLIPTIKIYKDEILETLMDVCNCISDHKTQTQ